LKPTADLAKQLQSERWFAALPENTVEDKKMKEVFRLSCVGCHNHNFTFRTKFDEKGWREIIAVMSRIGSYGYNSRANRAAGKKMEYFGDRLAAYLAKAWGPGPSPMKLTPRPRPTGDSTLVVIKEYDGPEPGYGLPLFNDGSDWSQGAVDYIDEQHLHTMN